jgi:chorismate-pyruvate lyase
VTALLHRPTSPLAEIAMTLARTVLLALLFATPAAAEPLWPNSPVGRWQAQALVATLDAELLASRSATLTLEKWCGDHGIAAPAQIRAERPTGRDKPADAETRKRLAVSADEPVRHRFVRLKCGDKVLSEADNWYVPSRLTPEMNKALDETDTPFGKVVSPLKPFRRTFEARAPWAPDKAATGERLALPEAMFEHRALLFTEANLPFSEVDETYRPGILDFTPEP